MKPHPWPKKKSRKRPTNKTRAKNAAAYPFSHGNIARQMRAVTIHY